MEKFNNSLAFDYRSPFICKNSVLVPFVFVFLSLCQCLLDSLCLLEGYPSSFHYLVTHILWCVLCSCRSLSLSLSPLPSRPPFPQGLARLTLEEVACMQPPFSSVDCWRWRNMLPWIEDCNKSKIFGVDSIFVSLFFCLPCVSMIQWDRWMCCVFSLPSQRWIRQRGLRYFKACRRRHSFLQRTSFRRNRGGCNCRQTAYRPI